MNNQFYSGPRLSFSTGVATGYTGQALEVVQKQADQRMYEAKREHYAAAGRDDDRRNAG
jgi:GGDEF domain-containing protein